MFLMIMVNKYKEQQKCLLEIKFMGVVVCYKYVQDYHWIKITLVTFKCHITLKKANKRIAAYTYCRP